ncbi:MAG: SPOR domain-containing protein [Rhodospirillales bacterium]
MPADAEDRIIPPSSQDLRERPDFEPVEIKRKSPRGVVRLLLIVILTAGAAGGWWVYNNRMAADEGGGVPIIRADVSPAKERPEQPGGMEIPNRDKEIYDQVDGGGEQPVERLLPEAEEPAPVPGADAVTETAAAGEMSEDTSLPDMPSAETAENLVRPESPEPPKAPAPSQAAAPSQVVAPEQPKPVQQAAKPAEAPAPAAPKGPAPPADAGGKEPFHRLQIASVRAQPGAEKIFTDTQKKHADLFGAKTLYLQRADLGESKGVYFRVRIGPYDSAAAAKQTCAVWKERGGDCIIIAPGK